MDELPAVVRRYLDAYNAQDVDALVACLTEDVAFENITNGTVTVRSEGKAGFEEIARRSAQLFSEREQVMTSCIATDARVAIRVAFQAVVAVDLPNGWTAGQAVHLTGASFFTLRDSRIAGIVDIS